MRKSSRNTKDHYGACKFAIVLSNHVTIAWVKTDMSFMARDEKNGLICAFLPNIEWRR
jgi:hypothetical protein